MGFRGNFLFALIYVNPSNLRYTWTCAAGTGIRVLFDDLLNNQGRHFFRVQDWFADSCQITGTVASREHRVDCHLDSICFVCHPERVAQHHRRREDRADGVGHPLPSDVRRPAKSRATARLGTTISEAYGSRPPWPLKRVSARTAGDSASRRFIGSSSKRTVGRMTAEAPPTRTAAKRTDLNRRFADISAAKFLAEVPDVSRFDSASQLAAFTGLTPRNHHSGSSVHRRSRLVKTGSVRLRTALFMPALAAMRSNPIIQALVKRLEARGKSRMTIVGAVMRKLVHLAYGVLKHRRPFDPNYLVNVQATT